MYIVTSDMTRPQRCICGKANLNARFVINRETGSVRPFFTPYRVEDGWTAILAASKTDAEAYAKGKTPDHVVIQISERGSSRNFGLCKSGLTQFREEFGL